MKHPEGHVFILVVLVSMSNGEIYYKEMDNSTHPYYYNCPLQFLELLPEPKFGADGSNDRNWRKRVKSRNIQFSNQMITLS